MKESIDFVKIMKNNKIIGVLNLNNMIPISDNNITLLKYEELEKYRDFSDYNEKRLCISFLNFKLELINDISDTIKKKPFKLYNKKSKILILIFQKDVGL